MDEYIRSVITGLFDCYMTWSESKQKDATHKIQALSDLLVKNKIYLRNYPKQNKRDHQQEAMLAQEWRRVGSLFCKIYPDLAQLCEFKSDYWVNSDSYSENKVTELGITIRNLELQFKTAQQKIM